MKALKTLFLFILKILKNMFGKNDPPTPIYTPQEMYEYWENCKTKNLVDLFFNTTGYRATSYSLDSDALSQLFDNSGDDLVFRVFMGANPGIPYGQEGVSAPSFTPIFQVHTPSTNANATPDPNTNSIVATWYTTPPIDLNNLQQQGLDPTKTSLKSPIVIPFDVVSIQQAIKMIMNWTIYLKGSLYQLVESAMGRLKFTTFNNSDAGIIKSNYNYFRHNDMNPELIIYLGFSMPVAIEHGFGLRIILELKASDANANYSQYYEVSNPCPPLC